MTTLHRNSRTSDHLAVASLADIEAEVADVLDVMESIGFDAMRRSDPRDASGGPIFQITEAVRGLAWAVGSLAKHFENHAVAQAAEEAAS